MREYLETRSDKSIFSNSLCNLARIVLKNNYFENGSLKYHQKRGFAIATKFASPYSNLFMTGLEKRIFFLWLRCFGEIFDIWTQGSQKLKELCNCAMVSARDLFGSQIPVTTGGFELRISCIRSSYLTR